MIVLAIGIALLGVLVMAESIGMAVLAHRAMARQADIPGRAGQHRSVSAHRSNDHEFAPAAKYGTRMRH